MNIPRRVFLILSVVVSINPFNGSLIKIPNPSDVSLIDEAMVNVIRNCLPGVMNVFLGGQLVPETIKELNGLNTFATINLKKLSSAEKLSYFHKKIDLLIINDTNVQEFLPSVNRSQFLKISTNEIMVFVICKMENICQGFEFDRKKYLDGYPVAAVSTNITFNHQKATVALIKKALNVRVERKQCPTDFIADAFRRIDTYDFTLKTYSLHHHGNNYRYSLSQPRSFYSVTIVTHNRGLLTPLEKIYNYYGYLTVISTTIILAMTFVVIYLSKHDVIFASFEIIRLLINAGIKTRMESNKSRIFFSMIFLYFLIIHGTFSGRLAGFLTKAEYRKNVETLEDLKDPRYTLIYANNGATDYITDEVIRNKTIFGNFDCKKVIGNNNSVTCIDDYKKLLPAISYFNLHNSKKPLLTGYFTHLMRRNWPLASRFNDLMIRCVQSGLSQKWKKDKAARYIRQIEITKLQSLHRYRPVSFDDLKFSFLLLGFGLTLSTISFISEIITWKKYYFKICRKMKQVRISHWVPKASVKVRIKKSFMKFIWYLRFKK